MRLVEVEDSLVLVCFECGHETSYERIKAAQAERVRERDADGDSYDSRGTVLFWLTPIIIGLLIALFYGVSFR